MEEHKMDVAFWPRENAEGLVLFRKLQAKSVCNEYDDEFFELLKTYKIIFPDSEHLDIFGARAALHYGDAVAALQLALRAFHKRKVNLVIWQLLIECYDKLGNRAEKAKYQAYAHHLYCISFTARLDNSCLQEILDNITMAEGIGSYAPLADQKTRLAEDGNSLVVNPESLAGEYIPWSKDRDGYAYFVGAFVNQEILNAKGNLLLREAKERKFIEDYAADFVYDIMRSKTVSNELVFNPQGKKYILPLLGLHESQSIRLSNRDRVYAAILGHLEYSYYRIEEPVKITSEADFVMGRPILLEHSPKRKKVVLNILVDALSWKTMRETNYKLMPNAVEFFSKGVIFENYFSAAEYTYPSLPNIETGMYAHDTQIFKEKVCVPLDEQYKTISEQMKAKGYYCVNIMGGGDAIYNGTVRGYDRFVTNQYGLLAYNGVERTIQQLEAFSDCDQFLFLHVMDAHPWPMKNIQMPLASQTLLSLEDRLFGADQEVASVYLKFSPLYAHANMQGVKNIDRSLKVLFDYLQANYEEDEYIVQLYSDHGCSVYDTFPRLMGEYQTNGAYMARGAGIPAKGFVSELMSSVDIYQVMSACHDFMPSPKLAGNLPAVFGGREREYTISNSIYPGQTYKLCIRTAKYEFQLESKEIVDEDGTVDLTDSSMYVLERGKKWKQNYDLELLKYFMDIAREHTKSFNTWGRNWPELRRERPSWFGDEETGK